MWYVAAFIAGYIFKAIPVAIGRMRENARGKDGKTLSFEIKSPKDFNYFVSINGNDDDFGDDDFDDDDVPQIPTSRFQPSEN